MRTLLPHISLNDFKNAGVSSSSICTFAIPREALSRGLRVRWFKPGSVPHCNYAGPTKDDSVIYSIACSAGKEFFFDKTRNLDAPADLISKLRNKKFAADLFKSHGIACPTGKEFIDPSMEEALDFSKFVGFPLVIKPTSGSMGKGVEAGIQSLDQMKNILMSYPYRKFMVESHISGEEYRCYAIGGTLVGIVRRIPPFVTGDGTSTIAELLAKLNQEKSKEKLPEIDISEAMRFINARGLSDKTILKKEAKTHILDKKGRSSGGFIEECTDSAPTAVKDAALAVARCMPDFSALGVDIIYDGKTAYVLEANTRPQISSILLPDLGEAKDFPRKFIDHFFPGSQVLHSQVKMEKIWQIRKKLESGSEDFIEVSFS